MPKATGGPTVITQTTTYTQTNLISDGAVPAAQTDDKLINPWGVSFPPSGPFWISDNGTGTTTVADKNGVPIAIAGNPTPEITIAPAAGQTAPATPTGQVFNTSGSGFTISQNGKSGSALFLFATEDGTISGWNPNVNPAASVLAVDNSGAGAVYKGLALATSATGTTLYAANFHAGTVDMFNGAFQPIGSFTDPGLPPGYAPFNVQVLGGHLFVTFAQQNAEKHDDVAGAGHGFVDEFDLNGALVRRVISGGELNSPWGLALAPGNFGQFAGDLLVGNFGDGRVNAFDPTTGAFVGTLTGSDGKPITIGDLWALTPGSGGAGSDPNTIFFTAGVSGEAHGLFGSLTQNSTIKSSAGNNVIRIGSGTNIVVSRGSDTVVASSGADTVATGANSAVVFGQGDTLSFFGGSGSATVIGGAGASTIFGDAGSIVAFGGAGGGLLAGGAAGNNMLVAGTGASTLFGGGSGDVLFANGSAGDVLVAGPGDETLSGGNSTGNNMLAGGAGNDLLIAGMGADTLAAGTGNATLVAGTGADMLFGGAGSDAFFAGQNTAMTAGTGRDLFIFVAGQASGAETVTGFGANDSVHLGGFPVDGTTAASMQTSTPSGTMINLGDGTTVTFVGVARLDAGAFV
jgi:uncharacterized protein (TIGR03118 family)